LRVCIVPSFSTQTAKKIFAAKTRSRAPLVVLATRGPLYRGSGRLVPRCGCRPKARQMRPTLEVEIPLCRAILRVLQWVAPAGRLSSVCTMTCSTLASSIVRGAPGRGSSSSPSRPVARRATQHDARPQCQGLRRLAPLRIAFQYPCDFTRQFDLRHPGDPFAFPTPDAVRRRVNTRIFGSGD